MSALESVIACNRFGLGARPGDVAAVATDPRGWLEAQIRTQQADGAIENSAARFRRFLADAGNAGQLLQALRPARGLYIQDVTWRTQNSVTTVQPFAERLVQFWSNHFAVSLDRAVVGPLAVPYENEAIRPHVFGKFSEMVLASARHPAMLLYLDNIRSIGPSSMARRNRSENAAAPKGLNENYAREVMELHTLGVDGGYTQTDVRELAKILTGWSLDRQNGTFMFRPAAHEPGVRTVLGKSFADNGEEQGIAALRFVSMQPATARHIATKLARHFIADNPPAGAVSALANTFLRSDGDLSAVTRTLIALDEAWHPDPRKYKSPYEHVISSFRAVGASALDARILNSFEVLGQRSFAAPSPQGWPDTEVGWLSGDGLMRRIEWSQAMASTLPTNLDARSIAPDVLGPWLTGDTKFMLQGAPSSSDALALLFLAPEFQRR